ncbi:MAG: hypothetical protein NWE92_06620 [Candidatus Bathyarchaeota archaeon]|nr:hypothetical protein [Candidatus Bathyarchaeota archaeon]
MIRTVEVLLVIIILSGAFLAASYFAVLPSPREISPMNLQRLSFTTLQMLDTDYDLSRAVFETGNSTVLSSLQVALSASLPANVLYNLTIYDINPEGSLYTQAASIANAANLGATTDVSTYTVASSNVTFNVQAEKIGATNGGTLYILNCSDANGWWITGYTAQSLATDLYNLLSPYFVNTIMIQNTTQLGQILNGTPIQGEPVQNAVVINTCGEAVPIPSNYASLYSSDYGQYPFLLGQKVRTFNWTWASIVGYPFYYVTNTQALSSGQNTWGIYGMQHVGPLGSRAFLQGINGQSYNRYDNGGITDSATRQVTFTPKILDLSNYYGIYPSQSQTSTRALSSSTLSGYNLQVGLNIFNPSGDYLAGSIYNHYATGSTSISGSLLAVGLTRTPDVRVTGLGLLSYYQPRLYNSEYTANGTSRLVVLLLGYAGES